MSTELIDKFLREAATNGVSVTVVYGYTKDDKPIVRAATNRRDANVPGMLRWLTRSDFKVLESAARAMFEKTGIQRGSWDEADVEVKSRFLKDARTILEAAVFEAEQQRGQQVM
jgi:hypothetical protein